MKRRGWLITALLVSSPSIFLAAQMMVAEFESAPLTVPILVCLSGVLWFGLRDTQRPGLLRGFATGFALLSALMAALLLAFHPIGLILVAGPVAVAGIARLVPESATHEEGPMPRLPD